MLARTRGRIALTMLLGAVSLSSGCYSLTNMAVIGFAIGTPSKVDPHQPAVAVSDIVGVSVTEEPQGFRLHLAVTLEDGRSARLVAADPAPAAAAGFALLAGNAIPVVTTFGPEDTGPLPRPAVPLVVPDWDWIGIDGHRRSVRASQLGIGSQVHMVGDDGTIPEDTVTLTTGLAASCGVVSLNLIRDQGDKALRRQTWQVSFYPPRPQAVARGAPTATIDAPTTGAAAVTPLVSDFVFPGRATLLTRDGSLFGPLPPTWSVPKVIAFGLVVPFAFMLDTVQWATGLGAAIDLPIALHYGWTTSDSSVGDTD